eukprot:6518004-Prymnesium_polylepis.1
MMLLVEIRKGFLEAVERVLVPDEHDLVLPLVEDVITRCRAAAPSPRRALPHRPLWQPGSI